jgi:hypothetical protein
MTLRVPVMLIKEELRAAILIQKLNQVQARRRETAGWKDAQLKMPLYRDDGLRTLDASQARVRFVNGDVLSLDQNAIAIFKPKHDEDADLELQKGQIVAAHSRVVTRTTRIEPQTPDTEYTAKVRDDMSTQVSVLSGKAKVHGAGKVVMVNAGFRTDVAIDKAPTPPTEIPDLPAYQAQIDAMTAGEVLPAKSRSAVVPPPAPPVDSSELGKLMREQSVGVPVASYHVQVSQTEDFAKIVFDKSYDAEERVSLGAAGLQPGTYWVRVAIVDLLGVEGKFGLPRRYEVGGAGRGGR